MLVNLFYGTRYLTNFISVKMRQKTGVFLWKQRVAGVAGVGGLALFMRESLRP